jgi:hypothetical protein
MLVYLTIDANEKSFVNGTGTNMAAMTSRANQEENSCMNIKVDNKLMYLCKVPLKTADKKLVNTD